MEEAKFGACRVKYDGVTLNCDCPSVTLVMGQHSTKIETRKEPIVKKNGKMTEKIWKDPGVDIHFEEDRCGNQRFYLSEYQSLYFGSIHGDRSYNKPWDFRFRDWTD